MTVKPLTIPRHTQEQLSRSIEGEALFDRFSRGRYSTDASVYQMMPAAVVIPRTDADVMRTFEAAAEAQVPVLARGGGTSQCGQTVGAGIVVDCSPHLNQIVEFDPNGGRITVQPGLVLDQLNAFLHPHRLWFPVDVSTSSRATIGGMTGNNSCGARSLVYGTMRDNVIAVDALLANGTELRFGEVHPNLDGANDPSERTRLFKDLIDLGKREGGEIADRFPKLMRRVGGYNIDALVPDGAPGKKLNLAHLLVGSEGTLAFSRRIELKLSPLPEHKVLGVCHFPSFYQAMDAAQHLVKLQPTAVELVDHTMIELSLGVPMYRAITERFVRGEPNCLLLVEFAGEDRDALQHKLASLRDTMAGLGFADSVVEAIEPSFQQAIWEVRKAGLNIMMSMKSEGKPVSFVEDCAVRLEDLAEYTDRLEAVFRKHGTHGTWYAHASVGCLHVRPVLNLKLDTDVKKMRTIAEEAFELVREYRGSHSGEHGDGLVRSEFHEAMFGARMVQSFERVKDRFDPADILNPGKIVRPSKMDDRRLFRYHPDYRLEPIDTAFDWSAWRDFGGAVEMCNNNGACRKLDAGVMCPSYRVTRDEKHLTRGRANTLRLAVSGQLGPDALASDELRETMKLCVGCKACKRECPTGVDMAKMKTEVAHQYITRNGLTLHERLVGYMPYYAPWAARLPELVNLRDTLPGVAKLLEPLTGFSAKRRLPAWRRDVFKATTPAIGPADGREVVLFADTFNTYFEPENIRAALNVLTTAGYRVHLPAPADGKRRALCCGRSLLAVGLARQARAELRRVLDTLRPFVSRGVPVIGLEPSCLFTLRDELTSLNPSDEARALAEHAMMFEEFLHKELSSETLQLKLQAVGSRRALLHGHCHQKAFGVMHDVTQVLKRIPALEVDTISSSCCGMAGAFGYAADTYNASMQMGELSLLPAVREADSDTVIVADGTSCRHQIRDGAGRPAVHAAILLEEALKNPRERLERPKSYEHH